VNGVPVSTTFSSGMLARFGQSLGELLRPGLRARELPIARILAVINATFVGGAVVGGVAIELWDNAAILVPTLALPLIGLVTIRTTRQEAASGD
jgi:uncharacterized membrane protein YoaK (UPF0700 family)